MLFKTCLYSHNSDCAQPSLHLTYGVVSMDQGKDARTDLRLVCELLMSYQMLYLYTCPHKKNTICVPAKLSVFYSGSFCSLAYNASLKRKLSSIRTWRI